MKKVRIKIIEPWLTVTLNNGNQLNGKIIERVGDSYLFEFDYYIKFNETVSSKYLIGKIEQNDVAVDLIENHVINVQISLAIYPKEYLLLAKRPSFNDMRGRFILGTISS